MLCLVTCTCHLKCMARSVNKSTTLSSFECKAGFWSTVAVSQRQLPSEASEQASLALLEWKAESQPSRMLRFAFLPLWPWDSLCCPRCDGPHPLINQCKRARASKAEGTLGLRSREDELLPAGPAFARLSLLPGRPGTLLRRSGCPVPGCWQSPEHVGGSASADGYLVSESVGFLCRLISDEISQFYFNCCWQHVVSDKKHIFCRDCIHQLG